MLKRALRVISAPSSNGGSGDGEETSQPLSYIYDGESQSSVCAFIDDRPHQVVIADLDEIGESQYPSIYRRGQSILFAQLLCVKLT